MASPVIIEAAINGNTRKSTNPNVPVDEEELVADALACFEAGAAIVHNHIGATNLSGEDCAEAYLRVWRRVLAERPDAIWYPTINVGPDRDRYAHIAPLAESGLLRMSLSDPGSVNLGRSLDGIPRGGFVYANSFDDIDEQLRLCRDHALGVSIAIYEPGFLRVVVAYLRAGLLPPGAFVKLYLSADRGLTGTPFGLPTTATGLAAYLDLLDGTDLPWAVSTVGEDLAASAVIGPTLAAGGHLHTGLEFFHGDRTPTNAQLVAEAVTAVHAAGRDVASCDEATSVLGLPRVSVDTNQIARIAP
jgi:uncharacterized protein (DUF849 family)